MIPHLLISRIQCDPAGDALLGGAVMLQDGSQFRNPNGGVLGPLTQRLFETAKTMDEQASANHSPEHIINSKEAFSEQWLREMFEVVVERVVQRSVDKAILSENAEGSLFAFGSWMSNASLLDAFEDFQSTQSTQSTETFISLPHITQLHLFQ